MKLALLSLLLLAAAPSFAQSDDCAGIVPTAGDFIEATVTPRQADWSCTGATGDQGGVLAFESHPRFNGYVWNTFDASGAPLGEFTTDGKELVPQPQGFEGTVREPRAFGGISIDKFDIDGTVLASQSVGGDMCAASIFRSSETGAIGLSACYARTPAPASMEVFDTDGNQTSAAIVGDNTAQRFAVGDENGMNLVVFYPGAQFGYGSESVVGQWFDDSGAQVSPAFLITTRAQSTQPTFLLRSLIGGGAALQVSGQWVASFPGGVAEVDPPPQFLADHPGWDVETVRGRLAYALVSRDGGAFGNHLPLYSAAGNRCGAVDFPDVQSLSIGADGTVIGATGTNGCTKRWWPALLSAP